MPYLAWPLVVLIIALVCIFYYRKPFERLLDRTSKIGKGGLETSTSASAQETGIERAKSGVEDLLAPFENAFLVEAEEAIRRDLDGRRVGNPADRERVLIRHLAGLQIATHFDRIYNWIFGSQLSLLQQLNSQPSTKEDVKAHYDFAIILEPDFYANYSFEQWLQFLLTQTLIRIENETINITVAGREFLKFVVQEGRSFIRS